MLIPADSVCDMHIDFRKNRGTSFGCTLFNDTKCYYEAMNTPLCSRSLEAEKCFVSIWHKTLASYIICQHTRLSLDFAVQVAL